MPLRTLLARLTATCLLAALLLQPAHAASEPKTFKLCWSIFAGWMPWGYAASEGIVNKWAEQYGIRVDVSEVPDYVGSIERYSAGEFDACSMTNMDALTIPAAAGVDSTALIIGDFSNGADAILLRGPGLTLKDLKGKTVLLVENSVSHYLLSRALEWALLTPADVTIEHVSDTQIAEAFLAGQGDAVITWNPILAKIKQQTQVSQVFSSNLIPGEIVDLTVVNSKVLAAHPELGKALTGAWFETQRLMGMPTDAGRTARAKMASAAGTTPEDFSQQLDTLRSFYSPRYALAFARANKMPELMQRVAQFADQQKLLGNDGKGLDKLGIAFSGERSLGNADNILLRFDGRYMQMAADKQL
ncbi:Urea carboxylase-related ABC transporter, periplasmic substrate-binding protein [Pseudomonas sp. 8BK]|uniref:putative urea ABC transporter substrate-binding protein n=1 Tax=Pseudomonas sp. 8BK TaxID=2653164 RepID=UPI0012F1427E|nr:putative urea ABC transporter substrate-binding protein [Pseudomonas sp. 8BK]VXB26524.1 Urea carboxylase-related ABC transporter, periplasmic substrate-binding protein [Pseudomonas sp. 8BK]